MKPGTLEGFKGLLSHITLRGNWSMVPDVAHIHAYGSSNLPPATNLGEGF